MLFHVTMTHTVDDCPGYNLDKMPELIASMEKSDQLAKEFNVKVHFAVEAAPAHVSYALLESDNLSSILRFLNAFPIKQDFKVTPVMHMKDVAEIAKAMVAKK